ncbi:histidine phosphatase family protein [Bailinhaonella thermotolerans]|uniref:Histidine phosphatase family protein n=1 Tax=Bailinhaonella thermotolerans TaxID=1070861 RepID=A0A3A4AKE9_9ACTN|nr:histidine phosphatase family protein [Bailinhaonella thermotolerans]RJL30126.1 histidine phosphatase family protein [Bailinhaonella thermotolerans]
MTRIVLVRHGQTEWHTDNRYAGSTDVGLTPYGREQARRLARWAEGAGLAAVYSSTLARARETARAAAEAAGLSPYEDHRLCELDFGAGEGLTTADMRRRFPRALAAFHADPVACHLPGGEDPVKAARRFVDCLGDVAAGHPGGRVLVVAHRTVIRLGLCELLGVPLRKYRRSFPELRNCSLTEIELGADGAALLEFNVPPCRGGC